MESNISKEELLRSAGFRYNFNRMAFIDRKTKKIISIEALEDHSEEWLGEMIAEVNDTGEWRFYFEQPPSPGVIKAYLAELG